MLRDEDGLRRGKKRGNLREIKLRGGLRTKTSLVTTRIILMQVHHTLDVKQKV
jgi:hypothetical protein